MKMLRNIAICLLCLVPAGTLGAEVIDGVIVTVNRRPVLRSEWDDAVRFEAFMSRKPLGQVTETERVGALQRLIDRRLLEMQMNDANYLAPQAEEVRTNVRALRAEMPAAGTEQGWQDLLASYGFSERDIEANVRSQKQVMNFVEVRLRPNVHVQPEEVQAYYRNQVVPDMEKAGVQVVTLEELEPKIRELLVQQHIDVLLDAWMHNLRQQAEIHSSIPLQPTPSSTGQEEAGGN